MIHKDSVVSSQSKYHWKIHASSSSAATYDFSGLAVIGAGITQLNAYVPLTEMTFNNCSQITHPGNTLTSCVFTKSSSIDNQGALYLTDTTQSALQTKLNKLVTCSFTSNASPSGALMLEYTGAASPIVLNMSGNSFTGNKKDIFWKAPASSNLTINLSNGANPSTYSASGANTVTFVSANTFSITNIAVSSEVRIFKSSDSTELAGVETIGTTTPSNCSVDTDPDNVGRYRLTYTHSNTSLAVYVAVASLAYQFLRQNYTLINATQELLISQIIDRQYQNL
jgi:hypothetical protein